MRIIAGTARSMPLKTLPGVETRPTTDRIKETLFNMIHFDLPGACFLDLFAGSGGIGLEAISRGAVKAVFVDNSKKAAACIEENVRFTKFTEQSDVLCMDAVAAIKSLEGKYQFDLIFMDPPYGKGLEHLALSALKDSNIITEDTILIVETSLDTDLSKLEMDGAFTITKEKRYKTNRHVFLKRNS